MEYRISHIFNPNPLEIAIEAAHVSAIAEEAKRETARRLA